MTRKDFQLIADTIKASDLGPTDRLSLARDFADALRSTNPQFDRARFLAACGVHHTA